MKTFTTMPPTLIDFKKIFLNFVSVYVFVYVYGCKTWRRSETSDSLDVGVYKWSNIDAGIELRFSARIIYALNC